MIFSFLLFALANAATSGVPAAPACTSLEPATCAMPSDPVARQPGAARMVTVTASAATASEAPRLREVALARLETVRSASGAGALAPSDLLALSARRHADYLAANGLASTPSMHAEAPELAAFSGADPFVRMRAAGYRWSYATELIGSAASDGDCIGPMMNSVYHAALLLSRVTEVGLAYGDGAAARLCIIDLGAPLDPAAAPSRPSGELVRYPWPGMTLRTGTFQVGAENPRPAPGLLPGSVAGSPVLVGFRNIENPGTPGVGVVIAIQQFELRDERNAAVPCVVLAHPAISGPAIVADRLLRGPVAVLVPRSPLAPGRYRVLLHATAGQGVTVAPAPWEFRIATP